MNVIQLLSLPNYWNSLYATIQQVIANDLEQNVFQLREEWNGLYNPKAHLFCIVDEKGTYMCRWKLDKPTWEVIMDGYCRWNLLNEKQKNTFWIDMFMLVQFCSEWKRASIIFKTWILKKVEFAVDDQ